MIQTIRSHFANPRLRLAALAVVSLLLCARMGRFVGAESVNILFNDQWQTFTPLFDQQSWWQTFDRQWGPHRLGLGFVITRALMENSSWNNNLESGFTLAALFCAAGLALWLKSRLAPPVGLADIALVALVVSPVHYETILITPSNYHSILPLCLLLGIALCLTADRRQVRYGVASLLAVFSIFTGFGIVGGAVYSSLLGFEAWQETRGRSEPGGGRWRTAACLIVAVGWFVFFAGYKADSGAGPLQVAQALSFGSVRYVGLMFAAEFQMQGPEFTWFGWMLAAVVAGLAIKNGSRLVSAWSARHSVLVLLASTSLAYAVLTAFGRVQLGAQYASSSRYMALLLPGMFAIHFSLAELARRPRFQMLGAAWVILILARCPFLTPAHEDVVHGFQKAKRDWAAAYSVSHSVEQANRVSGFIMPHVTQERIGMLEARRLNYFAGVSPPR